MSYTQDEMKTWKSMLTDQEKEQMRSFLTFLDNNHGREPIKITIQFQHKRFSDNTGFATLNVPRSVGRVSIMFATDNLRKTIEELLNKS